MPPITRGAFKHFFGRQDLPRFETRVAVDTGPGAATGGILLEGDTDNTAFFLLEGDTDGTAVILLEGAP